MPNKSAIYTRLVIAQLLNISEKRVKQLTEDGIISEYSSGFYKMVPAVQGYIKYLQRQVSDDDPASNYNAEKARLTRVKREDAELNLKVKKNELHESSDIEFIMTNMLIAFKSKLEVLPHKVLPNIVSIPDGMEKAEKIVEVLNAAIDEALNELSGYAPNNFDEENYLAQLDDTVIDEVELDGA